MSGNSESPAWIAGYNANQDGRSETANPYDPQSDDYLDWNDGWNTAEEELQ